MTIMCYKSGPVKVRSFEELLPRTFYVGSWQCGMCYRQFKDQMGILYESTARQNGRHEMCFSFSCPHCDPSFDYRIDAEEVQPCSADCS